MKLFSLNLIINNSLTIILENISKKFNKEWLYKNINYSFLPNNNYAITGHNGSGKSTLLQIIAGFVMPTNGSVFIEHNDAKSTANEIFYESIAIAAPYVELIEEMTANEFLNFHFQFKKIVDNYSVNEILQYIKLESAAKKQVRNFSSGMKQRLKLAQAFFSESKILLLDEPCSNLDKQGFILYNDLIKNFTLNRTVIVCSNDENEHWFCQSKLQLHDYKLA